MTERRPIGRRRYLRVTGAALGVLATTPGASGAEEEQRFLVSGRPDVNGVDVLHRLDPIDMAVVRGEESAVSEASSAYARDLSLSYETTIEARETNESATDEPFYRFQWDKRALDVPAAHETTRGEGSRVTVIDTGVDPDHPDLTDAVNEDLSRNLTGDGGDYTDVEIHGTHVSGLVAADDRNERGIVGTAPGTDLVALRVFDESGGANYGDILAAILYSAAIGADVANLSLGTYPVPFDQLEEFHWKALNRATIYASRAGTLLVSAAGDDDADLRRDGPVRSVPTEAAWVLGVSATGPTGFDPATGDAETPAHAPAPGTNYGTNAIDIGAPGGNSNGSLRDWVLSTVPTDHGFDTPYAYLTGTSMAAAQVTGAAALIASTTDYPVPARANVLASALKHAARVPEGYDRAYYGTGFLDVLSALGARDGPQHTGHGPAKRGRRKRHGASANDGRPSVHR
ncbi:Subtilase family protein [Halomicrobium zhouii]|uniref:Subtilase family protein n=1 Tax=Halomicrobium zhouii TaxID=767519 RepID=A0A1I6K8U0_9EURY|nr:S8 family serine peptidase [Halomicrobium zhouii]SFR87564.1 Subtilase family protein [Halomicrobium zhouii]